MREALLVDLGALVYELHRHGRREPELLQAKASELTVVDQEVRALAGALGAGEGVLALVSAGIAGSCERCGTLLSTDARYCSGCGAEAAPSLPGSATAAPAPGAPAPVPGVGIGEGTGGEGTAGEPIQPSDLDPDATGVIGSWQEPEEDEAPADEAEPAGEPAEHFEDDEPPPEQGSAHAPWLADEDERVDDAERVEEDSHEEPPVDPEPPAGVPAATERRRSGGAVGKVAGVVRRARGGG